MSARVEGGISPTRLQVAIGHGHALRNVLAQQLAQASDGDRALGRDDMLRSCLRELEDLQQRLADLRRITLLARGERNGR